MTKQCDVKRKQAYCRDAFGRNYNRLDDSEPYEPPSFESADDRSEISIDQWGNDEHLRGGTSRIMAVESDRG